MSTSNALFIEQNLVDDIDAASAFGVFIKQSIRKLRYNDNLSAYAEQLIALQTGREVFPGPDSDKRRTPVPAAWVKIFRGIAAMFGVNEKLEFTRNKNLFGPTGWRASSWAECKRIGRGCRHMGGFSNNQIRTVLRIFAKAGYVERHNIFNAEKKKSRLFLRFRADKIMADIERIKDYAKAQFSDVVNTPKSEAVSEKTMVVHHQDLIYNTTPDSQSVDLVVSSGVAVERNKKESDPSAGENFNFEKTEVSAATKPSEVGDKTFRLISKLVQSEFCDGSDFSTEFTFKHVAMLRRWVYSGQGNQKLTLKDLESYMRLKRACNPGGWEFSETLTLDFFLNSWPSILLRLRRIALIMEPSFGRNLTDTLETYRNRTSNLMDIVRHSVACFQRSARVYGKSKLSSAIETVPHFNEYISFRLLGVTKFSDQLLAGNRMQLKREFMSDHLVALDLLNRCPAIAEELGVTEWDKYQLMKERNASYEYGLCLQARAEALNM